MLHSDRAIDLQSRHQLELRSPALPFMLDICYAYARYLLIGWIGQNACATPYQFLFAPDRLDACRGCVVQQYVNV